MGKISVKASFKNIGASVHFSGLSVGGGVAAMNVDFEADTETPEAGDVVTFTDLSDSSPSYWSWRFGDGSTSEDQNPTHIYTSAGSYDVTLLSGTESNLGDVEVKSNFMNVTSFGPMQLSPFVYYETIGESVGAITSLNDKTGAYTATGNVDLINVGGQTAVRFMSGKCLDTDTSFASRITSAHTIVISLNADNDIPAAFECLLGAYNTASGGEHQYSLFQKNVNGAIRFFLRKGGVLNLTDTLTQGLGSGVDSVLIISVDPINGVSIRVNGVNRILDATNNGDLTGFDLPNLDIFRNLGWGCRNNNGAMGNYHNGKHFALIGYDYILTESQMQQIENYYVS